jgi:hypothetical protein
MSDSNSGIHARAKIAILKFTVFVRHEEKPKAAAVHHAH